MYLSTASLGDFAYSFLFGVMANMVRYRSSLARISLYEEQEDDAGVYGEILRLLWDTLWFDNLLYAGDGSTEYEGAGGLDFGKQQEVYARYVLGTDPLINVSTPGVTTFNLSQKFVIPESYSNLLYSFGFGLLARFADFFDPFSQTKQCNDLVQLLESKLVRINDNVPGKYAARADDYYAF